jgi:hypothetical protein
MTYKGIVKHGKIKLEEGMPLAEGTPVRVEAEPADWQSEWEAFAREVDREWKSPLSALEALRESRR